MYRKLIKGYLILAILLMLSVSLSTATCPWFIKNELYTAQCGVQKDVPASLGILRNDPSGSYVVNPDDIGIDIKYGTIEVHADGSFVYDPSPDIQSGTYVKFNYIANNGVCDAKYPGIATIQVSCKCRPHVEDLTLCGPVLLEDVIAAIEEVADCWGCGDFTPVFDFSKIIADAQGYVQPGRYCYTLKCLGCIAATGYVTIIPGCTAYAPDIEVCEGDVTLDELEDMILEAGADCIGEGCDEAPAIDLDGVDVETAGTYTYTATCGEGTDCESSDEGSITVNDKCDVVANPFPVCEGFETLESLALIGYPASCGDNCLDCLPDIDDSGVLVDEEGIVTGGSYEACCMKGDCESCATGNIKMEECPERPCPCVAVADDIEVCLGVLTRAELQAKLIAESYAKCDDPSLGIGCDATPQVNVDNVNVDGNGKVTGGEYTVTCQEDFPCQPTTDTGTVTANECCQCDATAPDLCIPLWSPCSGWHEYSYAEILERVKAAGGNCGTDCSLEDMTIAYVIPETYDWEEDIDVAYTVTCAKGGCTDSTDEGTLQFRYSCGCS